MMKENKTAYLILMIASAIVTVGALIAIILIRHDWLIALTLIVCNGIILGVGAIPLLKPEWSFNYRWRRVDGRWKNEKTPVPPNLFLGLIIFITVTAAGLSMLFE